MTREHALQLFIIIAMKELLFDGMLNQDEYSSRELATIDRHKIEYKKKKFLTDEEREVISDVAFEILNK